MELITISGTSAILNPEVSSKIAEFETQMKMLKEKEDELKKAILAEMESRNIIKLETPELLISYIAPTDRETFDTKRFRAEFPITYDEFVSMSPVKSSIRIKVKKGKEK